ncbi:MAG: ATP-dependent helicase HrpB [Acidobacteriota bacterium]|nr:ATP-dependent helicase HrpB [Acidobacteriota bacterium]
MLDSKKQPLPIDALIPQIIASLKRTPNLVVEAPPGAGKTTRVPVALLDSVVAGDGEVWVLEPRRLAARLVARRVAEERGEKLGETVGYQVRFEEIASARTRLRFVTEGLLTRRLLSDPQLARVGCVVLDEFHERHLQADLALALLRRLQLTSRPDLRLVAMSATLDAGSVARYLGDCPSLRSEGRLFPVRVEHLAREDVRPISEQVASAVTRLLNEGLDGDVLVFLPGAGEIRRAQEACASIAAAHDLFVVPLHGELTADAQDAAVRPARERKIVLSTNVAETSITVEGVAAVVDSGLARVARHSPWSGLARLEVARVSRASAVQRAGRAGRTRAGRCLRLYTAQDFAARAEYEAPEIQRLDLAEAALELHAAGVGDLATFDWLEPPTSHALDAAEELLRRLGAINQRGGVTELGRVMLRLPVHPRLARLVAEGERRGIAQAACVVAALVGERDIREREMFASARDDSRRTTKKHSPSDLLELLDLFNEAARSDFAPVRLRALGLNAAATRNVERARRQLQRVVEGGARSTRRDATGSAAQAQTATGKTKTSASSATKSATATKAISTIDDEETALLISILAGYPDRVARRRETAKDGLGAGGGEVEVLLAGGGAAVLAPESVVRQSEFLVAVDAEERRAQGRQRSRGATATVVRLASAIEPEWLIDLFADAITDTEEARWDVQHERVEVVGRMLYDGLVLDERRERAARGAEVSRVLAEAALNAGVESFVERAAIDQLLARIEFVARTFPEASFPSIDERDVRESLIKLCEGRRSFAELRDAVRGGELISALRAKLTAEQSRLLSSMAPERIGLASGRQARVNYEREKSPWTQARLQDFFGMRESPRIAKGRVALVLHLLAPNRRAVQVTSDLASFWSRHYPQVRRELSRRYPRHDWREDPLDSRPK